MMIPDSGLLFWATLYVCMYIALTINAILETFLFHGVRVMMTLATRSCPKRLVKLRLNRSHDYCRTRSSVFVHANYMHTVGARAWCVPSH